MKDKGKGVFIMEVKIECTSVGEWMIITLLYSFISTDISSEKPFERVVQTSQFNQ